ncbi:hypothetical protein KUTeg_020750 [Tegillarca granosa]|uniref:Kelch domain-containing protein 10 n=1 Tax=Tegillarca granosa TaxID=220873 RepID=A0ABQ9E8U9_TEGGR|nr:hypothetical protein KUTeg_020750 [Tegillarca granosa]
MLLQCVSNTADPEYLHPRSGHRVAVDDANMYVLGGYNPRFWEAENTEDTYYPLFREVSVRYGRNLLCFGGTGVPFGHSSSNQLHICNLETLKWRLFVCSGEPPQKKYGHTMTVVGKDLLIVGGTSGWMYNMDVHKLDLQTAKWEKLVNTSRFSPESRYRHEVVCCENKLFMFGGGRANAAFGLEKVKYLIEREGDVYIVGGLYDQTILDDIWKLCLRTYKWTKLSTKLQIPVYFHSADVTPEGCMYVFGGVCKYDNVRTNGIQRIWLQIPSLQEIVWDKMCSSLDMESLSADKNYLFHLGIPMHFLDRLS